MGKKDKKPQQQGQQQGQQQQQGKKAPQGDKKPNNGSNGAAQKRPREDDPKPQHQHQQNGGEKRAPFPEHKKGKFDKKKNNKDKKKGGDAPAKAGSAAGSGKKAQGLNLEDILALGGDESDLKFLEGIDKDEEVVLADEAGGKDIDAEELKNLVNMLGFNSFASLVVPEEEEEEEEGGDEEEEEEDGKQKDAVMSEEFSSLVSEASKLIQEHSKEEAGPPVTLKEPAERNTLLVEPGMHWHELVPREVTDVVNTRNLVNAVRGYAQKLLDNEVEVFRKKSSTSKGGDQAWLNSILTSGTLGDRLAALVIKVQESPVHRLSYLDTLMTLASKKGKRVALMTIDTLYGLWSTILPTRKLIPFARRPLTDAVKSLEERRGKATDMKVMMWLYEEELKARYKTFVDTLQSLLMDQQMDIKAKVLSTAFDLLSEYPEQEAALLAMIVNKLGDPERKLATKAAHLLAQLIAKHPNMKVVVAREVQQLLHRPNIGAKAQYYAICFLNQIELSPNESELAAKLIEVYFRFFEQYVKKDEVHIKHLSALLTGVNRAYPFAKTTDAVFDGHVNTLFRVVHVSTFNTSVQALMLLLQVMDARNTISDRFYTALYEKLQSPELHTSGKQGMFLNVVFRAMKADPSTPRTCAFAKRLLQACSSAAHAPTFTCAALMLLSEVVNAKPALYALIDQPMEDEEDEHFVDAKDDGEEDNAPDAKKAPAAEPGVRQYHSSSEDEDEESGSEGEDEGKNKTTEGKAADGGKGKEGKAEYDAKKRDPRYAHAESTCLWEMPLFSVQHFHPSAQSFAQLLMAKKPIDYKGDPLQDFTLMRFLDRFVFRNPKKQGGSDHGGSIMQRKSESIKLYQQPVNSASFVNQSESKVAPEDMFFYQYFKEKSRRAKPLAAKKADEEDIEPVGFDEDIDFAKVLGGFEGTEDDFGGAEGDEMDEGEDGFPLGDGDEGEEGEEGGDSEDEYAAFDAMDFSEGSDAEEGEPDLDAIARGESDESDGEDGSGGNVFASAEEFAHLLEDQDEPEGSKKQRAWEAKASGARGFGGRQKKGGRGATGGNKRKGGKRK